MMNLSQLITSIKMDLGIYGLALPFENENQVLHEVLKLKTIKTFSIFAPYILKINMPLKDMEAIQSNFQESIYRLPDVFGDRQIVTIKSIKPWNKLMGQGYVSTQFGGGVDLYNDLMLGQANANIYSTAMPPFTFSYEQPNIIHVYNLDSMCNEIIIEIGLEHADNFATIPNTAWESFHELAVIDIKKFLYSSMKHYTEIQTAYGNISLKIDDWANADQERKDIIEKWRDLFHLDQDVFVVI